MRLSSCLIAVSLPALLVTGCSTVSPDECWPNMTGGFGGSGTIPIGAGVGAATGDYADPPRGPLDYGGAPDNPCVTSNDKSDPRPSDGSVDASRQAALLQHELDDQSAGGLTCASPTNCVDKCVAEQKYCWAAYAVHPYKPDQTGELFQCIDSLPPAKAGGSYTCLYRFANGDVCIFAYGSKLGPFTLPAPPPLCVYKTQ